MTLSDIAIRNRVFSWMLMAALILFGAISFKRLGVSQLPDVDMPVVNIGISLQGAAPQVMELEVVDTVEKGMTVVSGITSMWSTARTGNANVSLGFDLSKDIDLAMQDVQNALSRIIRSLPKDIDPPVVSKTNPEDQPILWIAVTSSQMRDVELMAYVRDHIKDRFSTIDGVGEVFLGGYIEPNLRVWLSSQKLHQNAITAADVLQAITLEHADLPAGLLETEQKEFNLRTLGEAPTAADFAKIPITRRGGSPNFRPITIGDVAVVEEGLADVRRRSRSMGVPAVGLGFRKQAGANAVAVAHAIKARMRELSKELPAGAEMGVRFDTTKFIEEAVRELNFTLFLSAVLTALVCWLFLGSWSATLNVVMAIPTSVIGTFTVLYALGFTLNAFTLLGLSLAIGIVVDDAIMVLENIVRHRESGKGRKEAASVGAREITFAAIAATAAIIAIFMPVAFMSGLIGKYFFQFGVTLSAAVAISLLEALTLTPMRCAEFLDVTPRTTRIGKAVEMAFKRSEAAYGSFLPSLLNHRLLTIGASLLFFVASLFVVRLLKKEFIPAQDQGTLMVRIQAPLGSSLNYTDEKMKSLEAYFSDQPDVDKYFASTGGFGGGEVSSGMMFLTLKPKSQRPVDKALGHRPSQQELANRYREALKEFKGFRATIQDPSLAGFSAQQGGGFPIQFSVRGGDWNLLVDSAKKVMGAMEASGTFVDVDSNYREGMPEIEILPDRNRARDRGVSVADIAQTINAMIGGITAGKFSKEGHRYDVRMRLMAGERNQPADINQLYVRNNRGELIPLSQVVTLNETQSLQSISRQERMRAISISSNLSKGVAQSDAIEKVETLSKGVLPQGYSILMSGTSKTFRESFDSLIFALVLGLVISYMVLGSQFNSFIHPLTVLVALPFSLSGAFLSLWIGGLSLNVYSMIGIVLLMGIVKKNSILLVDFTNQCRAEGLAVRAALTKACPMRLRPILMTSFATIAGALPAALAVGPGAESRIPMANAVIGGILVSTTLTLFVVPCVYSLFSGRLKGVADVDVK